MNLKWLPALVYLHDYGGVWDIYLTEIYKIFKRDFITNRPSYQGRKIRLKQHQKIEGKEIDFWHIISEGPKEEDRIPDLRRCERIGWPKPIIENSAEPEIKIWKNKRKRNIRVCLWLENYEYVVILDERKNYHILWTTYPVEENHRKRKFQKEYQMYLSNPF